jgi:23S rRNA pseudouridine1911/1915/1917 synthase
MKETYKINAEGAGMRVDNWLARRMPAFSRSRFQKWIKAGEVLVNGKKVSTHVALVKGDKVTVETDDIPVEKNAPLVPRPDIGVDVVYEDDDIIVVNKPSGLIVHPAVPGENDTLANAIIAQYPEVAKVGDDPSRPGIVHRLDREASGLLVIARTPAAFKDLKSQFQAHVVKKEYAVLVDGYPPEDSGTIKLAIGRSTSGGKMAARPAQTDRRTGELVAEEGDKIAITHYRIEEKFPKTTLLTVRTETGRTHQIRAHFHALGIPVVGDTLYGTRKLGRLAATRLFLHAKTLAFHHPVTDKEMSFSAPLPEELENMLTKLRKKN